MCVEFLFLNSDRLAWLIISRCIGSKFTKTDPTCTSQFKLISDESLIINRSVNVFSLCLGVVCCLGMVYFIAPN